MQGDFLNWLLLALCIALSFVLSGMETGVFALSRLRVRQQYLLQAPPQRGGHQDARAQHTEPGIGSPARIDLCAGRRNAGTGQHPGTGPGCRASGIEQREA